MRNTSLLFAATLILALPGIAIAEDAVWPGGPAARQISPNLRSRPTSAERSVLVVVDGTGRTVGTVLDIPEGTGRARVPVTVSGIGLVLEFDIVQQPTRVEGVYSGINTNSCLVFESSDCSGPPLLVANDVILPNATVAPPGQTLYVERPDSPRQEYPVASVLCNGSTCGMTDGGRWAVEAVPVTRLDQLFPAPHRLVVRRSAHDRD